MHRAAAPLLAALALCAACSGGGGTASSTTTPPAHPVVVANFAFSPTAITVRVGDAVTWEFHQPDAPHNVVSLSGPASFNSGTPQGSGTFVFTFTQAGTYTYVCQVHPNMTGSVVVTQ